MSSSAPTAVFVSYASQDAAVARRITDALRAAGIEVWFDQNELRGGDEWDRKIRGQVRTCALFMPIISANTQTRREGYFRLEWKLADERTHLMAKGTPFVMPVCIDATADRTALVPDSFLLVQWTRLPGGETPPEFCEQVKRLLVGGGPIHVESSDSRTGAAPRIPDYELLRQIGRGSYGDVWLARGLTGIYRAIKIVWRDRFADAGPFEREFKGLKEFAAISLGESTQMALLHVGRNDEAGFFYYVMELADDADRGREIEPSSYAPLTLAALHARRGRVPASECVTFGVELARVLAGLHRRGLVHRDIKPSNVILVGGVPKLADIGLVAPTSSARTFVGTEGFVPPEGPGSPGADVFALGKVLYELATGRDRNEFPQLPPAIDRLPDGPALIELNKIILRACDPRPERRHRDGAELLADLETLHVGRPTRAKRFTFAQFALAATALVVLAGGGWWYAHRPLGAAVASQSATKSVVPPGPFANDKSIAVLPFENLSPDKENEFFADGIHEDVLANLQNIRELRVVSRQSVLGYRGVTKKIPEIARELGVAYILEGSVRRAGDTVRVSAKLVDARTDAQLWSSPPLDRKLTDIFAIQSEIAQSISTALRAALSPQEKSRLARRPTESSEAYDDYLKARSIRSALVRTDFKKYAEAEDLLETAVRLDALFVEAWAELTVLRTLAYVATGAEQSPTRLAKIKEALDTANRLDPDSPDVIHAWGDYFYRCAHDFPRAAEIGEKLLRLQPNNPDVYGYLAQVERNQGHWPAALAVLRKRVELDPRSIAGWLNLETSLEFVRHYDQALRASARLAELAPTLRNRFDVAEAHFRFEGSLRELDAWLAGLSNEEANSPEGLVCRKRAAIWRGDYAEALRLDQAGARPTDTFATRRDAAMLLASQGNLEGARARIGNAADELKQRLENEPTNASLWSERGLIEAILGHQDEALRCASQAVEFVPEPLGAVNHAAWSHNLAIVRAWVGDKAGALVDFSRQLPIAGATPTTGNYQTVHTMRRDPRYFPLWGDPRFEMLLNDPKNNAPLF